MAYAFVQSATGVSHAGTLYTATTTAANFTGANTLFLIVTQFYGTPDATITDSVGGNTWEQIIRQGYPSGSDVNIFRCAGATVSSTFTATATLGVDAAFGLVLLGFSGGHASPDDQEVGNAESGVMSTNAGLYGITPSANDCVIIAGLNAGIAASIDDGFTLVDIVNVFEESWGATAAYLIQTTATLVNPTFSWGFTFNPATVLASFRGDPTITPRRLILSDPLA